MKKILLSLVILGVLTSGFANEILDVEITKIERENSSLAQHDLNVDFLYDNMDCNAKMSFTFKKTYIYSNAFFCKGTSGYTEFYSEFPTMNRKYEYIIIDKTTGIKINDLNSIEKSKLSIQKNEVQ